MTVGLANALLTYPITTITPSGSSFADVRGPGVRRNDCPVRPLL